MGLSKKLEDNNIIFLTEYWGLEDLSVNFDIKILVENNSLFSDEIRKIDGKLVDINSYFDYLIIAKIKLMSEVIPFIKSEDNKIHVEKIVKMSTDKVSLFSQGDVIQFINENYNTLLIDINLVESTKKIIIEFQSGISDNVFLFLAKDCPFFYLNNFDNIKKILYQKTHIAEKVFCESNVENFLNVYHFKLFEFLKKTRNKVNSLSEMSEQVIDKCYIYINSLINKFDDRNILYYYNLIRDFHYLLLELKDCRTKEFEVATNKADMLLTEYLKNYGQTFSHQHPIEPLVNVFNKNISPQKKLYSLTHMCNNETKGFKSIFDINIQNNCIDKLCSSTLPCDEHFTMMRQQTLRTTVEICVNVVRHLMTNEEYTDKFIEALNIQTLCLCELLDYDSQEFLDDTRVIIDSILKTLENSKEEHKTLHYSLCYSSSMLLCAYTEKILRIVYQKENPTVINNVIQLGKLINDTTTIEKILGYDLTKVIGFFLSKYGYIGDDIRNKLAHLSTIKVFELTNALPIQLLYLYLCVINQVVYYYTNLKKGSTPDEPRN